MRIWGYKERKTSCETGFTTPVVKQGFHQLKTSLKPNVFLKRNHKNRVFWKSQKFPDLLEIT